jgi:hypothetical protein
MYHQSDKETLRVPDVHDTLSDREVKQAVKIAEAKIGTEGKKREIAVQVFSDPAVITCIQNTAGFEGWVTRINAARNQAELSGVPRMLGEEDINYPFLVALEAKLKEKGKSLGLIEKSALAPMSIIPTPEEIARTKKIMPSLQKDIDVALSKFVNKYEFQPNQNLKPKI